MAGAPLPLLGTFHEVSLAVADVRGAVEFYERLGFTQAITTDAFAHPYGALTDGRLVVGVHGRSAPSPTLTFVRPGVAAAVPEFVASGIELIARRTGEEEFHELSFADPTGQAVTVLEARTYSPVARRGGAATLCGHFAEVSLPATGFEAPQAYWEALGFVATGLAAEPWPHLSLTSDFLDLSFHAAAVHPRPLLVFRDAGVDARIARLEALGLRVRTALPGGARGGLIEGPDGTALLLLGHED